MSSDAIPLAAITDRLYLEIPQVAEQQHQAFSTPGADWQAHLNQMSLAAFLPWLQEEQTSQVWPSVAALSSFWELVNGTAIVCEDMRLVLIPTPEIDLRELRVPQEWVDIPSWSADYYLAVQVNPDAGWIRIWGYATHHQLKTQGAYEDGDRTYSLDEDELIQDLNVLWIARQLCPEESLRAEVAPVPILLRQQAENLLERLGNPAVIFPRLAVPFQVWAALLEHGGWRQRLYERRQGFLNSWSVPQWLQVGLSGLAEQIGWSTRALTIAQGMRSPAERINGLSRQLAIAGHLYELQIFPQGNLEERIWRFELCPLDADRLVPSGFKLRLLTEDLQPFEHNEDIAIEAVDRLYVDVILEPEEGLVWEIEPTPEGYDREILNF
ncbi:MAG: DUF1822 family protein [Drouetiella hepatica Uher 2000/2452]|uniref:DUF1822 family protein n=1 Tax=Drouetiella hepatica Uher 2000/2452 TaxID=904376 RepID=A0A951UQ04_9CYAN|nr:DUF1822 family protein [Drouetiella hepatica Uher 2000/2452]